MKELLLILLLLNYIQYYCFYFYLPLTNARQNVIKLGHRDTEVPM